MNIYLKHESVFVISGIHYFTFDVQTVKELSWKSLGSNWKILNWKETEYNSTN